MKRNFKDVSIVELTDSLQAKLSCSCASSENINTCFENYFDNVGAVLDNIWPKKEVKSKKRKSKPRYNDHIYGLRKLTRQNEKIWRRTGLEIHRQIFREHRKNSTDCITQAKINYYNEKLAGADQRTAFQVLSQLVKKTDHALPEDFNSDLCDMFATFFDEKIAKIHKDIDNVPLIEPPPVRAVRTENLSCLSPTSCAEVNKNIMACKSKPCCLDVIPRYFEKNSFGSSQIITRLVNISFTIP